jgi:hypothetical protein
VASPSQSRRRYANKDAKGKGGSIVFTTEIGLLYVDSFKTPCMNTLNINPIIYAEVSIGFERIKELEVALPASFFRRLDLPWEAAFLAGKCFRQYHLE